MKYYQYISATILVVTFIAACKNKESETEPSNNTTDLTVTISRAQFESGGMRLGQITNESFPQTIRATGMIEVPPENKAVVSAFIGGYVKETPLLIGDVVKKGQALLSIENPEFVTLQQNYLETKQQVSFLQAEYERQQQLIAENISSQKSFLKAESDYKAKLALYNGLKQKLRMLNFSIEKVESGDIRSVANIYAPIEGSITKMNVSKGTYVSPSDEIMEIIDNDHIHLELNVFEKDVMKLEKGQLISFAIPESSEEAYEAEVYLIGTNIEDNRTIKVHGELKEKKQHNFLTGMFVDANIVTSSLEKQALPSMAVVEINNISFALKLVSENDETFVFEKVVLKTGDRYNDFTAVEEVESEVADTRYLTKGAFSLLAE
ncbi:efflux RND transporter periplasmic adaptor subunit [Muriicola sp.]|uniref:efflux RND transporter periplasmic adaptor subunit n=1 Tax=Muriicola sp. TaxID=2020856 RepID=UPI003C764F07